MGHDAQVLMGAGMTAARIKEARYVIDWAVWCDDSPGACHVEAEAPEPPEWTN